MAYTIGEASKLTGLSPDTLRYYEKIGLLPSPIRGTGGVRKYTPDNLQHLSSILCLKRTGLSLQEIKEFIDEGQCIGELHSIEDQEIVQLLQNRRHILVNHLRRLEEQRHELEKIIEQTQEKLNYYHHLINKQNTE